MKGAALFVLILFAAAGWAGAAEDLSHVKSVYLLPMSNGFDQYLANRITNKGLFGVVADPTMADAVLTDRLGPAFESRLDDLAPLPAPESKPAAAQAGKTESKPASEQTSKGETKEMESGATTATGAVPFSTFGGGKGNVFLVDIKTRRVLWSTYDKPKDSTSRQLNRTAGRVADEIERALTPNKK